MPSLSVFAVESGGMCAYNQVNLIDYEVNMSLFDSVNDDVINARNNVKIAVCDFFLDMIEHDKSEDLTQKTANNLSDFLKKNGIKFSSKLEKKELNNLLNSIQKKAENLPKNVQDNDNNFADIEIKKTDINQPLHEDLPAQSQF